MRHTEWEIPIRSKQRPRCQVSSPAVACGEMVIAGGIKEKIIISKMMVSGDDFMKTLTYQHNSISQRGYYRNLACRIVLVVCRSFLHVEMATISIFPLQLLARCTYGYPCMLLLSNCIVSTDL